MDLHLKRSYRRWHPSWFYVKNCSRALPNFTVQPVAGVLCEWSNGPVPKEKERLAGLLGAIKNLKERGLIGVAGIGAYHVRRVAHIMAWTISSYIRCSPTLHSMGAC